MRKQTCPAGASTKLSSLHLPDAVAGDTQPQSTALNGPFTLVTPLVRLEYHVFSAAGIGSPLLATSIRTCSPCR